MKTASLVHVEIGIEYYKGSELEIIEPTAQQKLLWEIVGMPNDVIKTEQKLETEIDRITGKTKREVESQVNKNFLDGMYDFLPPIGVNHSVELRFNK